MELTLDQMFLDIGAVTATFALSDQRDLGRDRTGVLFPTANGARLWQGTVTIRPHRHRDAETIEARMAAMTEADGTFLICPPTRFRVTENLTYAVTAISEANRRLVRINDDGSLTTGDWIGVNYSGGRKSLHQVLARSGNDYRVVPPFPLSVAINDVATVGRPSIRAIVVKDGWTPGVVGSTHSTGISYSWIEFKGVVS